MANTEAEPLRTMMSVSRQTGIPYLTLRYLVHTGRIPSVRVAGMPPRLRLSQVKAAMVERRTVV
jgi:excisionase family DNA binding protein